MGQRRDRRHIWEPTFKLVVGVPKRTSSDCGSRNGHSEGMSNESRESRVGYGPSLDVTESGEDWTGESRPEGCGGRREQRTHTATRTRMKWSIGYHSGGGSSPCE